MHIPLQLIYNYTNEDFIGLIEIQTEDSSRSSGKIFKKRATEEQLEMAEELKRRHHT